MNACLYGPGRNSMGFKCSDCGNKTKVCLNVHVEIDNSSFDYITCNEKIFGSLFEMCEPVLKEK
jgi:hypothetical protein